jgi:hypothetical protein
MKETTRRRLERSGVLSPRDQSPRDRRVEQATVAATLVTVAVTGALGLGFVPRLLLMIGSGSLVGMASAYLTRRNDDKGSRGAGG